MNASAATTNHRDQTSLYPDAGQKKPVLVFYLDEQAYGLSIECVVQIIPMLKLAQVPQVEPVIEGVANIHGKIVPVLSARRILGLAAVPHRLYTPIILTETYGRTIGLIVDEVEDVIRLAAGQFVAPASILPEGVDSGGVLEGVVYHENKAIIVLDSHALLRPLQFRAMSEAIRSIPALKPAGPPAARPEISQPAAPVENDRGIARRRGRKIDAALAGEMANLAADLLPSEGQIGPQPSTGRTAQNETFPSSDPSQSE